MKERHIIAAVADGGGIGYDNKLLFKIPADMERFKTTTMGNIVIMGRKTFESIGSKPLKCRNNIVVTTKGIVIPDAEINNLFQVDSLEAAYELAETLDGDKVYIIGGASLYNEALNTVDYLDITEIFAIPQNVDTYFPKDLSGFLPVKRSERYWNENTQVYRFVTYKKHQ